jgi:hypothetical protein
VLIVLFVAPGYSQEPPAKLPIPDESAQEAALELVTEVYKADYEQAKSRKQKGALAKKLLQEGVATEDDPTGRHVLLCAARDIAAERGDVDTAYQAIAEIDRSYEVDVVKMKAATLADAAKALREPDEHRQLVRRFLWLIDEAVTADRYDIAKPLGEIAFSSARTARDADLISFVRRRNEEVKKVEREYEKVQSAMDVLKTKPTDPEANLTVGKFHCFLKSQWAAGVLRLALGSDETLTALAAMELDENPVHLELGDRCWEVSLREEGLAQSPREFEPVTFGSGGQAQRAVPQR